MRVALYVTCLVDLMRPSVGFAALKLLETAGCTVVVPPHQTCCGQPAWSAGERQVAAELARKVIEDLEGYAHVVVPSGSCADHLVNVVPHLLADAPQWAERAQALAARTQELTSFLASLPDFQPPGDVQATVSYHDSCKGLRGLGIQAQPRQLLQRLPGVRLEEMPDCAECCGFGGAFAARFGEISTAIVDRKCDSIASVAPQVVAGGDLGCLLNIEGRLRRRGDSQTRVLHIAEVLAGD